MQTTDVMVTRYVISSLGIVLGIVLAIVGYRSHDQMGNAAAWIMLMSIGIIMSSLVVLVGLFSTVPGVLFFFVGALLATVSAYRTLRAERTRQHSG